MRFTPVLHMYNFAAVEYYYKYKKPWKPLEFHEKKYMYRRSLGKES